MLKKANKNDKERIIDYCLDESTINLFLISDIENFGFESEFQDVWIVEDKTIQGILLRYHTMLIVYSKDLDMDFHVVNEIIETYPIDTLGGKAEVMDEVENILSVKFNRVDQSFAEVKEYTKVEANPKIQQATVADAKEIALAYGDIEEFKDVYSHDVNEREAQIKTRIESSEGKHFFIKDDKGIVAHGNTTAENQHNGMVGGIFTRQDMRSLGYATDIVEYLIDDLMTRHKTPSVLYEADKESFYKKFGFEFVGKWSTLGRD